VFSPFSHHLLVLGKTQRCKKLANFWGRRDKVREVWLLQEEKERKFTEIGELSGVLKKNCRGVAFLY